MARPRKEIDSKQFEALCKIQCTQAEICDVLDVTDKTLTRWCRETYSLGFSDIYKKICIARKSRSASSSVQIGRA